MQVTSVQRGWAAVTADPVWRLANRLPLADREGL